MATLTVADTFFRALDFSPVCCCWILTHYCLTTTIYSYRMIKILFPKKEGLKQMESHCNHFLAIAKAALGRQVDFKNPFNQILINPLWTKFFLSRRFSGHILR